MPVERIVQLRNLLAEKFPGSINHLEESRAHTSGRWPTGVPALDTALDGGLAKGELTEIVAAGKSSGSASMIRAMLDQAAKENQIIALVDGCDSLDVTGISAATLARLLWVRCRNADEALKAADLLLRDNNFSCFILDLAGNPAAEVRKIPATIWHRWQRLLEETSTICAVLTPQPTVGPAKVRITLKAKYSLKSLDTESPELLHDLQFELSKSARLQERKIAV